MYLSSDYLLVVWFFYRGGGGIWDVSCGGSFFDGGFGFFGYGGGDVGDDGVKYGGYFWSCWYVDFGRSEGGIVKFGFRWLFGRIRSFFF